MYIAIHLDADRKGKALKTASKLNILPRELIFGVLAPIWVYAAENKGDGTLPHFDPELLEAIALTPVTDETINVLVDYRWLDRDEDGAISVHDWAHHQPFFAERARSRRRRLDGDKPKAKDDQAKPGKTVLEEKRGEEKRVKKRVGLFIPLDLTKYKMAIQDWYEYKSYKTKPPKSKGAVTAMHNQMRKLEDRLPDAINNAMANGWKGFYFGDNSANSKKGKGLRTSDTYDMDELIRGDSEK